MSNSSPNHDPDKTLPPPTDVLPTGPPQDETQADEHQLVEILDRYLAELKAGMAPSRDELIQRHPHLAERLEACLAGLEFIHRTELAGPDSPQRLGDFRLLREVGRGGMGAVYEAEQISLGRRVAVKVLRFGAVSDPEAVDRFRREAETVARLHHTNIVPIFFVGSEGGVNYYAMQFIEGRSLAEVLAQRTEPLDVQTVAEWGLQAAEALTHAHQRDVIHRDVKPSNLLLDEEGRIWLTDFGLAKRLDDVTLSMTGALLGTPRYMSPEQASAARHRTDHRTDLYSLGATLYELATGQPVFSADTPHQVISQILNQEPTPPRRLRPDLPRDLETILLKCLAKEPEQRYRERASAGRRPAAVLDGRPIRARRAGVVERGRQMGAAAPAQLDAGGRFGGRDGRPRPAGAAERRVVRPLAAGKRRVGDRSTAAGGGDRRRNWRNRSPTDGADAAADRGSCRQLPIASFRRGTFERDVPAESGPRQCSEDHTQSGGAAVGKAHRCSGDAPDRRGQRQCLGRNRERRDDELLGPEAGQHALVSAID